VLFLLCLPLFRPITATAEQVPVRHIEGVTLGFMVVRTLDGTPIAYGDLKQVVKDGRVNDDLSFHFKDGSFYEEITVFTQNREFHLVSDQVLQKGPSFKQQMESWINAETGEITVHSFDKGKDKWVHKRISMPEDASNGLVFTIVKNIRPDVPQTTVSMVAASTTPRIVKLEIFPANEKVISVGLVTYKAQHFIIKFKIMGIAGVVAPVVGKQPPDMHVWVAKSEAPTFIESEGPLYQDGPIWRIQVTAPDPDAIPEKRLPTR
jgi:hypothetical protein